MAKCITMVDIFEHDKFLFITFIQGGRGHTYCRTLATLVDTLSVWIARVRKGARFAYRTDMRTK